MRPTDRLRDEHRLILRALAALEAAAQRLDTGAPVSDGWWSALLAWLRAFADGNHHAKEEEALFPLMRQAGVPEGGPLEVMLEEHVRGRALLAAMERETAPGRALPARLYVDLLRAHIDKENGIVLPLADAMLEPPAVARLARDFARVEAAGGAAAALDAAEAAVDRLERTLGDAR